MNSMVKKNLLFHYKLKNGLSSDKKLAKNILYIYYHAKEPDLQENPSIVQEIYFFLFLEYS